MFALRNCIAGDVREHQQRGLHGADLVVCKRGGVLEFTGELGQLLPGDTGCAAGGFDARLDLGEGRLLLDSGFDDRTERDPGTDAGECGRKLGGNSFQAGEALLHLDAGGRSGLAQFVDVAPQAGKGLAGCA